MRRKQWTLIFKALGNENRLKILQLLWGGDIHTVSDLADELDVSIKVTSQHLSILSRLNMVEGEGKRSHVFYSLSSSFPKEVHFVVSRYLKFLDR